MFAHLDLPKLLNDKANELLIEVDRKKFYPFFKIVEKYISDASGKLIVSGSTADYMLMDKSIDFEFVTFELYCDDAVKHARAIADLFYKSELKIADVDLRLTRVSTRVPNKKISVLIGDREMVNLRNLQVHSGVYIIDVVLTVAKKGLFDSDLELPCISPEHQLIEIYNNLTDPKDSGSWPELLQMEHTMRKQLGLVSDKVARSGGRVSIDELISKLYKEYASQSGHIVVGNPENRLQVISMYKLEDEEKKIKTLLKSDPARIEVSVNYPHVPTEMRVKRMTAYAIFERIRKPVIDVFDTATYSLVSFNVAEDGIKVGTLFIAAKHMLIDMWTIRYIRKRNQITEEYFAHTISKLRDDFKRLFSEYDHGKLRWKDVFPLSPNNYFGHYEDEDLAVKRMARKSYGEATKRYYDYYPYFAEKEKNREKESESLGGNDFSNDT